MQEELAERTEEVKPEKSSESESVGIKIFELEKRVCELENDVDDLHSSKFELLAWGIILGFLIGIFRENIWHFIQNIVTLFKDFYGNLL